MSGQKILLIDDDATLRELLASHLQTAGYVPLAAPDGPAGLRLAAESAPARVEARINPRTRVGKRRTKARAI